MVQVGRMEIQLREEMAEKLGLIPPWSRHPALKDHKLRCCSGFGDGHDEHVAGRHRTHTCRGGSQVT